MLELRLGRPVRQAARRLYGEIVSLAKAGVYVLDDMGQDTQELGAIADTTEAEVERNADEEAKAILSPLEQTPGILAVEALEHSQTGILPAAKAQPLVDGCS